MKFFKEILNILFPEPKQDVFAKHSQPVQNPPTNKDDAYAQFMKEMEQMMKWKLSSFVYFLSFCNFELK